MLEKQKKKDSISKPKESEGKSVEVTQKEATANTKSPSAVAPPSKAESTKSFETSKTTQTKDSKGEAVPGAPKKVKRTGQAKKDDMKTGGSKVNNKINERDLKDPKNKDCEIY